MSKLHARHVADALRATYDGLIDMSDCGASGDQRDKVFLTRALAAFAVRRVAGIDPTAAAGCVIDGTDDNGIDAVHVDLGASRLTLVQSKWDSNGTGSLASGDALKFIAGIKDLTDLRFDRFNERLSPHVPELEQAVRDPRLSIRVVVAISGSSVFSEHAQRAFDDLEAEMNETQPLVEVELLGLKELHKAITADLEGDRIAFDVTLEHWGQLTEPFSAFYGVVDAQTVAEWYEQYADRLFSQNLRKALGFTPVNSSLVHTLTQSPDNFWYFNNGITVLCDSIAKTPKGGPTRTFGEFKVEGVSVVNGAQTVASVFNAVRRNPSVAGQAKVWVRFISLEGCPPTFATEVTRATNTQNTVENRDFVALDEEQDRLRTEMLLSMGKLYSIKRGEQSPPPENGCTVVDATVALACAHRDSGLAVLAKSAVGRLWDDIARSPYKTLFNSGTTAHRVWRCVSVLREVDAILDVKRRQLDGRARSVAIQGNRMVLHAVFGALDQSVLDNLDASWDDEMARVPALAAQALASLIHWVEAEYSNNYITSLFKNASRCRVLADRVQADMTAGIAR